MNYTENYHLPQWEVTDRIMRVDFNEAMANIDSGITDVVKSFSAGIYWGTDEPQKIVTGFRPRFILVHTYKSPSQSTEDFTALSAILTPALDYRFVTFEDDGFTVKGTALSYPLVNRINQTYAYIAFR